MAYALLSDQMNRVILIKNNYAVFILLKEQSTPFLGSLDFYNSTQQCVSESTYVKVFKYLDKRKKLIFKCLQKRTVLYTG